MQTYLDLLTDVLETGEERGDRTGTGTLSVFGRQVRYDLREGFPCLTTKKLHLRSIIHELLWFLKGETNISYLKENKVTIWDEWADEKGDLGPVYGQQWRSWPKEDGSTIDQINNLINGLKNNPTSRRHLVSAWNVGKVDETMMVAQVCGYEPREFVHTFGDLHLYSNHLEQAKLQLSRNPMPLPKMQINPNVSEIDQFKFDDFELANYEAHPHIKAPVAV